MVLPIIILTFSLCAHAQRGAPPLGSKASDPDAYYISEYDTIQMINLDYVDSNNHLVRKFANNWVPLGDFFRDGRMAVAMNWHETIWKPGGHSFDSSWISIVRGYGKYGEQPDRKPYLDSLPGRIVGVADFDANGYKDLVVLHTIDSAVNVTEIAVYYFDSSASMNRIQVVMHGGADMAWTGDFNCDGHPDLLILAGMTLYQVLGTAGGLDSTSFRNIGHSNDAQPYPQTFIADFNHDGCDDYVHLGGPTGPSSWFRYGSRDSGLGPEQYRNLGRIDLREPDQHTGVGYFLNDSIPDFVLSKPSDYTYTHYNEFTQHVDTMHKTVGLIYIIPGGPDFQVRPWLDDSGQISVEKSRAFVIPEPTLIEPDLNWTYNYWQDIKGFGMFDSPDLDIVCSDLGPLSRDSSCHVLDIFCRDGSHFLYSCGPALDQLPDAYIEPLGNLGQPIGDWNQDGIPDFLLMGAYYDTYFTAVRYVASILPGGEYIPHTKRISRAVENPQVQNAVVQVYPNPLYSSSPAHIRITLDHSANVTLTISNLLGKAVQQIQSSEPLDEHIIPLDFHGLAQGTYLVRVRTSRGEEFYSKFNITE